MKVKSKSEVAQSYLILSDPMDCSLPGSSVHGIFQARVLEWGAIAFSKSLLFNTVKILPFIILWWTTNHPVNSKHFMIFICSSYYEQIMFSLYEVYIVMFKRI